MISCYYKCVEFVHRREWEQWLILKVTSQQKKQKKTLWWASKSGFLWLDITTLRKTQLSDILFTQFPHVISLSAELSSPSMKEISWGTGCDNATCSGNSLLLFVMIVTKQRFNQLLAVTPYSLCRQKSTIKQLYPEKNVNYHINY